MPKRAKITLVERRNWLRQYEEGVSIDQIARESERTQRTVTDHLEHARRERQHDQVQVDLIREGYRDHYRDLLNLADQLAESSESPRGVAALDLSASTDPGQRLLYKGLRSHTAGSKIWTAVRNWGGGMTGIAKEADRLETEARKLVSKETREFPEVLVEGFVGSLHNGASGAAQGIDIEAMEYVLDQSGGSDELRIGNYILAKHVEDEDRMAKIQKIHEALLKVLLAPQSSNRLRSFWKSWAEARDVIQEEVAILKFRKVLTGQCDLCPAGDTSARRTPNRRRDE